MNYIFYLLGPPCCFCQSEDVKLIEFPNAFNLGRNKRLCYRCKELIICLPLITHVFSSGVADESNLAPPL